MRKSKYSKEILEELAPHVDTITDLVKLIRKSDTCSSSSLNMVSKKLKEYNIRVEKDFRNEKLGLKVREAQIEKIPYLLVIGQKEMETESVSPRKHGGQNLDPMTLNEFVEMIKDESNPHSSTEVAIQ